MTYITATLTIIITLCCSSGWQQLAAANFLYNFQDSTYVKEYTRNITLKQGVLQGIVVASRTNDKLIPVAHYRGIPYAAPPVGDLRFMPPVSPVDFGQMIADTFMPVCPQNFPDPRTMDRDRGQQFMRLKEYLMNQSEDCLYLNVYAPYPESGMQYSSDTRLWPMDSSPCKPGTCDSSGGKLECEECACNGSQKPALQTKTDCKRENVDAREENGFSRSTTWKYPVMVYIHGESFEWNSGNPYDGSVLAAYGRVIVVTLNFRLGVLGFLMAGSAAEHSSSNFGLVDQIAALVWIYENIGAFGGDPNSVTLFGHGTGAACISLLTLSPMVLHNGNKRLFQRAIMMGGSALSDWALAGNPRDVTYQVAQALNCQINDNFASCLRKRRLKDIMAAAAITMPYRTRFGPVVDSRVIANDPKKSMTTYNDLFRRFELMYGVAEIESINLLSPDALRLGMLEKVRDQELRKYMRSRCEMKPELCFTRTLATYQDDYALDDEQYDGFNGHEPDVASLARDAFLDIMSDARTVAPVAQMAKYHAALNAQSYFYVFTHKTASKEYIRNKSYTGEELPYVFGVPLGGSKFHFVDHYTKKEILFSEIIMTYFCNFAYTGDPNVPRKYEYYTSQPQDWMKFDVDWPEFDLNQEKYLQLGVPPYVLSHYREREMRYWNDIFPKITFDNTFDTAPKKPPRISPSSPFKRPPPWILDPKKYENFNKTYGDVYGEVKLSGTTAPINLMDNTITYGTILTSPPDNNRLSTTIMIVMGTLFLLSNILLFVALYLKKYRKRKLRNEAVKSEEPNPEVGGDAEEKQRDCNLMRMMSGRSSRSDDRYEAVKTPSGSKTKLPRQMSNSTIDAHTKVRDWITSEIVHKYSPRFLRRPRHTDVKLAKQESFDDSGSTLGRSPTRPVSPDENFKKNRPPLMKSSSIPVQKSKKPEKVSVAIDATPTGRGPSVLQQQPIELTKSLDIPSFEQPLRRSVTLEDFTQAQVQDLRKSTTSINLQLPQEQLVRIEHSHSKSEPVQDIYACTGKKMRTFDPNADVNVTSRDETIQTVPMTPEESLQTIKRRNFPKVLPDYPSKEALAKKRRSMPNHAFMPIPEVPLSPNTFKTFKFPPAPPPRTTSTLARRHAHTQPVCQSAPMLAEEPPPSPEPEVVCNNVYFGPLIPKLQKELSFSESSKLNTQPIYDSLRVISDEKKPKAAAKTVITTDPDHPIKKIEPKVIIKPTTMARSASDPKKHIPRVVARDNLPDEVMMLKDEKKSQIPVKNKSSSSESSPSEESDTGTVVKRI